MSIEVQRPNLTDYQKAILYNGARFTCTEASTKAGKTFCHIFWLFEYAHGYEDGKKVLDIEEGYNFWWVAPSHGQARIAFNRMRAAVRNVPNYNVNITAKTIETPLGSIIYFKTAKDPDALYGEDVYAAVFDEAPRAKYAAFVALRTTLTATRAPLKMIGNFGGISNWMHQLKEKAKTDPQYAYYKITAWDAVNAGILEREEIEQAQKDLNPKAFKALYLAEAQESEDMLISYDAMNDLFTNKHVTGSTRYMTADIALHGSDKFVVLIWEGFKVINIDIVDKCEADEVESMLKLASVKWRVARSNIVYDADGLGSFLRGYLRGANPFNNGGSPIHNPKSKTKINYKNLKTQCGYLFGKLANKSEVFFDIKRDNDSEDMELKTSILEELECLQSYNLDNDGKVQILPKKKIKEIIGRSPDILDALIMRMYFEIKPKSSAPKSRMI